MDTYGQASSGSSPSCDHGGSAARFGVTRWSVVLAAGGDDAESGTRRALEELIRAYWFPLYAYVRRQGESPASAEDIVQDFFACLLERRDLAGVDRAKGRFRSFLLASIRHAMANRRDRERAVKRGGRAKVLALDALDAETRYALEPADNMTPERLFDRRWALTVLDEVLARLRDEYERTGKAALFAALQDCLAPQRDRLTYAQLAAPLGMTEGALKVAVHRLRRRYRDLLREEIAQTVGSADEVADEIAYLLACL